MEPSRPCSWMTSTRRHSRRRTTFAKPDGLDAAHELRRIQRGVSGRGAGRGGHSARRSSLLRCRSFHPPKHWCRYVAQDRCPWPPGIRAGEWAACHRVMPPIVVGVRRSVAPCLEHGRNLEDYARSWCSTGLSQRSCFGAIPAKVSPWRDNQRYERPGAGGQHRFSR